MSFPTSCTEITFSSRTGFLEVRCPNGEKSALDLNSIIGLNKDKKLIWDSSGFLSAAKSARIYNYGNMVDLEVDVGRWAPQITTLPLSFLSLQNNTALTFQRDDFLRAAERERLKDEGEEGKKKGGVWRGLFGRPEKGPDFLGQSRITGRLR